jgi:hypothetical protein
VVSNYTNGMMGIEKKPVKSPREVRVTIFKKLGYLRVGNFLFIYFMELDETEFSWYIGHYLAYYTSPR